MSENILTKLNTIQTKLKAPKGQFNAFGKYKYRSCEDILESIKPFLQDLKCVLTVTDEMINMGDRYYVKATATIHSCEDTSTLSNTAYAREEETKKGMDASQITGTASSYARKYALNGLLCIDDTKDADTQPPKGYEKPKGDEPTEEELDFEKMAQEQISKTQANALHELIKKFGADEKKLCDFYKVAVIEAMTNEQYSTALVDLRKKYSKDK